MLNRRKAVAFLGAGLLSFSLFGIATAGSKTEITICHRTGSGDNPYLISSPSIDSSSYPDVTLNSGHLGHTGPVWPATGPDGKWGDIVPPFTYLDFSYPGMNWTAEGQAIWNNGCSTPGEPSDDPSFDPTEPIATEAPTEPVVTEAPSEPVITDSPSEEPSFEQSQEAESDAPSEAPSDPVVTEEPSFEQSQEAESDAPSEAPSEPVITDSPSEEPSFEQSQEAESDAPSEAPSDPVVTEEPSFEQSQEAESDAPSEAPSDPVVTEEPSFEQSEAADTAAPSLPDTSTIGGTNVTASPANGSWLLVVALGAFLVSFVCLTPARARNR